MRPKKTEGAGKTGCALHPRSRVQKQKEDAHEHTGSAEAVRPSLRNGFTVSFVLSPVTGLLSPSPARSLLPANLTPAPGRQDHTTSPSASALFVKSAFASTASHPDVRDDGQRPLVRDETARNRPVIWVGREAEYFCARGWTVIPLIFPRARRSPHQPMGRANAPSIKDVETIRLEGGCSDLPEQLKRGKFERHAGGGAGPVRNRFSRVGSGGLDGQRRIRTWRVLAPRAGAADRRHHRHRDPATARLCAVPLSKGRVQFVSGIALLYCDKLDAVPEGVPVPADFNATSITDCRHALFGLTTARIVTVTRTIQTGAITTTKFIAQPLDAQGKPIIGPTLDSLIWILVLAMRAALDRGSRGAPGRRLCRVRLSNAAGGQSPPSSNAATPGMIASPAPVCWRSTATTRLFRWLPRRRRFNPDPHRRRRFCQNRPCQNQPCLNRRWRTRRTRESRR